MFRTTLTVFTILAFLVPAAASAANPLPQPTGKVMLTVSGNISDGNGAGEARFDLAMLRELGVREIKTSTAWTDGASVFQGVSLNAVLERVGATGDTVKAIALNDYAAELPRSDADSYPVLLAYAQDGKRLSVRNKGPLWVVYPRDDYSELMSESHNNKWVWQLNRLEIQ